MAAKAGSIGLFALSKPFKDTAITTSRGADFVPFPSAHPEGRATEDARTITAIFEVNRQCFNTFIGLTL
jgi:hypothetical protein